MLADLVVQGREQTADWIETTLLARGPRPIGNDELYRLAEEEAQVGAPQIGLALGVMKRRADLLGQKYPFQLHDVAVRCRQGASNYPYASLLLLTPEGVARQTVIKESTVETEVLFECLTEAAVSNLWGEDGRALRFGWPSDVGRPQEFNAAVLWLAEQMGLEPGSGYRPPRRKDGGVDVVAWRPFPDFRGGIPIVLVQCTLQSDILTKASDVDTRVWASWLALDFDPITALAVPQTIPSGVVWDQLAIRGMVLERMRISDLIDRRSTIIGAHEWTASVISQLAPLMAGSDL